MCTYMCACVHITYTYVCLIHTLLQGLISCACLQNKNPTEKHTYTCIYTYKLCIYLYTYVCMEIYAHENFICMHVNTYTYIYIYIYSYT